MKEQKKECVNEKSKLAKAKARERSGSERNLFLCVCVCVCVCGEYGGYFGPRVKILNFLITRKRRMRTEERDLMQYLSAVLECSVVEIERSCGGQWWKVSWF